ncbi:ATP-binding cassette domain-containing protein [Paracrocinitomix mangrovi]|uniref:ABC-F family ATP-binding cassette domain-containing protein n=1 Tax=Paracrocinitomix mangrovi TaxID=2862509 RepID=UPI001C8D8572|nr:ABC-F family ATP-binding cassette domain-containing protein [Paracrocinitomix mangrovi]UKN03268.1 ATP-binding cassette domain-containing protein [Paracrocinitomix mangrovi]
MVTIGALSYHLPQGYLYKDISLFIDRGDKIGLTGKNGVGKSTLLGIISKRIQPSAGTVAHEKGITLGYLTQDIEIPKDISVRAYIQKSNEEVAKLQDRLDFVNSELTTRTDYESDEYASLIEEVTELNDRLTVLDAFSLDEKIEQVLKGLGFKRDEIDNAIGSFSGGWQMRVELAKLLVNNPDVLLIDEPTNHLDIVSIQWLENYLKNFKGGLVLISHDRRFLDNVTNRTIEIANQRLYDYKCNYSKYLVLHAEEMERVMQAKKNQDREIKRTEQLIDKYRAKASKASFAQSLIKKLEKVDRIEIDNIERAAFNVKFTLSNPSGKRVLDIKKLSKTYGDKKIFSNLDVLLSRGEKIALLGPNGVGKSTLIKCITKSIDFDGEVEYGHNVSIGYFAQDSAETLDPEKTVFETIDAIAKGEKRKDIRSILGAFLFSGEDVDKYVKVLSGGERTRLAICKLLFADFNLLIMDEPTNHLDIQSKEILKDALKQYEGTLLLVSHDRDFLDGLSNMIWEIHPTSIKTHYFGVNEFLKRFDGEEIKNSNPAKEIVTEKSETKQDYQATKEEKAQLRKLESAIKSAEIEIEILEAEIALKTAELEAAGYSEDTSYRETANTLKELQEKLNEQMSIWENSADELEQLKSS